MPPSNFRQYVDTISPPALLQRLSSAFVGVTESLVADQLASGLGLVLRMPWLLDEQSPDDVLPMVGQERRMPAYPAETRVQYRQRLHGAWDAYSYGGSESAIINQLAAAGYPQAQIQYYPSRTGPNGALGPFGGPYWSQFWVRFPIGSHEVTPVNSRWDAFNWDDGTLWGPAVVPPLFIATVRGIVRKWKPVDWICRGFIFEITNAFWDDFNWDDGTLWSQEIELEF